MVKTSMDEVNSVIDKILYDKEDAKDDEISKINKEKVLVSACLLGANCKYSGGNNKNEDVISLISKYDIVPICPECFGGLPIPRVPSEIKDGKVFSKTGEDLTKEFETGARQSLYLAEESGCQKAVLKERSPSCGYGKIYDGTFTGTVINGNGVTADLLCKNGIKIFGESNIKKLL